MVLQVALSLVLLTGALLFGRSLRNLMTLDTGLKEDGLLIAQVDASNLKYTPERRAIYYNNLLERLRAIPGVERAANANIVQLSGSSWNPPIQVIGQPIKSDQPAPLFNRVTPGYFETMGTPMVAGRDFNDRDTLTSPEVAIVSKKFQEEYLNGADPIGRQFRMLTGPGEKPHSYQIVGVVKDSKFRSVAADFVPLVFVAMGQDESWLGANLIVRSHEPAGPLTAAIKNAILAENPNAEFIFQVFRTQVSNSLLRERLMATLSGFFGGLAALLASVGLYGVISYMVARRRNEIGIRVALGASRADVVRLVFREAAIVLGVGILIGVALSLGGLRATQALLYGLQTTDPVTIGLAAALLAAVSLFASWVPAYRASRLDPVQSLREE